MLRVLILGGTTEGRQLAAMLVDLPGIHPISSLAGRVNEPSLPSGESRIGGFGGSSGLADWLVTERISAVIDATHPFAATISRSAADATSQTNLPLLTLRRPGWREQPGDNWHRVPSLEAAAEALGRLGERIFLTTGRQDLQPFAGLDQHWFLLRAVDPPQPPLPTRTRIVLDRGPFSLDGELRLMRTNDIQVLVTKDSGGELTAPKLAAARQLRLPVVMINRPAQPSGLTVDTVQAAVSWINSLKVT
jgi:precorrin-6A/cobalt-precorrin-6A reductase